nr:ATP-binding protein [Limnobacter humi]
MGISPDKQQQLFEPFTQLHSDMATRFGGAGLGLTIVKALAELMHGSISVESQVNQGSRFTLLLPMKCQPQFETSVRATVGPRRDGPAKLFIADGDVNTLDILDSFLVQRGFDVLRAADGHAALALLLDQRLDGVLMNVQLPLLDGLAVMSTVRASKGPNQQVLALAITDRSLSAAHLQGLGKCFETTVCKPLNLDSLLQWLDVHLQL